jgi:hypothetical protein
MPKLINGSENCDRAQLFEQALSGDCSETYYEMFNSADSDEVVLLLRNLHKDPSENNLKTLTDKLDLMLTAHVESIV